MPKPAAGVRPHPRELVLRFARRMVELTDEVGQGMAARTGGPDIAALHRAVVQGRVQRKYQLPSGTHYSVHGIGCWITGADGAAVDVDLAPDGTSLMFDPWRIGWFAESIRVPGVDEEQVRLALRALADEGVLTAQRPGGDWYVVRALPPE